MKLQGHLRAAMCGSGRKGSVMWIALVVVILCTGMMVALLDVGLSAGRERVSRSDKERAFQIASEELARVGLGLSRTKCEAWSPQAQAWAAYCGLLRAAGSSDELPPESLPVLRRRSWLGAPY